ncbi:type VI secretion system lipoprotein TssJ [Xenorhabdus sp. BG5]|uniref:type VI secretion system lipoprotein TssJ n=1 Tax=Xenorhabdus sp. BG5 TaxID=2782014 RepID=UPI001D14EF38|nr:type VI secretion system lipoprotein TssJ [Xenorhabdus sp. BG5]
MPKQALANMMTMSLSLHKKVAKRGFLSIVSITTALIAITGCSSKANLPPYKLIFNSASNVNDSAPVKIDVFLLKSNEEFMSADFFSLQDKAQNTLGDKLVNKNLLFIRPFQPTHCLLEKNQPEANYIGLIVEYKKLNGKKWRISFPVPVPEKPSFYEFWRTPSDELRLCVKVTNNGLSLIKECNLSCVTGDK